MCPLYSRLPLSQAYYASVAGLKVKHLDLLIYDRLLNFLLIKKYPCLLITDDTILVKTHSQKIALVHYQHSGHDHDILAGMGLLTCSSMT